MAKPWLSVTEAARVLEVSRQSVHEYINKGLLPAYRVGGIFRIKKLKLDRFLDEASPTK